MITEHALLSVIPGQEDKFEAAFAQAKLIISIMPGFLSLQLSRGIEQQSTYLMLIEWETLEDHTQGFRNSEQFQQWRNLLHHFYEPMPLVEHFEPLTSVTTAASATGPIAAPSAGPVGAPPAAPNGS